MNMLRLLLDLGVVVAEAIFSVKMFETFLVPRRTFRGHRWAFIAFVFILVAGIAHSNMAPVLRMAGLFITFSISIFLFCQGSIMQKLGVFALQIIMLMLGEVLAIPVLILLGMDIQAYVYGGWWTTAMNVLFVVFYITAYLMIKNIRRSLENRMDRRTWRKLLYCFAAALINTIFLFYSLYEKTNYVQDEAITREVITWILGPQYGVAASVMMLGLTLTMFSIIFELYEMNRSALGALAVQERLRHELKQNQMMAEGELKLDAMRSDMKEHLLTILKFVRAGDHEGQSEYLRGLISQLQRTMPEKDCGNKLLNHLLSSKCQCMEQQGILPKFEIGHIPERLKIDDMSLCALVTNLFDNAIEACMRLDAQTPRWIWLILRMEGDGLYLRMENPCPDAKNQVKRIWHISSKRQYGRGIGLANIRKSIYSFNGELTFSSNEEGSAFVATCFLPDQA